MKILFAGDTHGNLGHAQYLVRAAKKEGADRVFVLGDFGAWEHQRDGVRFFDQLNTYCNINNIRMYFIDGNHDKTSLLLEKYSDDRDNEDFMVVRPYIRYAWRGHRWTWDDVRFIALGGAYSVDKDYRLDLECQWRHGHQGNGCNKSHRHKYKPQDLWFPEEEMSDEDMAKILTDTTKVDVILAHDKPRTSKPGWNRKDLEECWPNQDRLQNAVEVLDPEYFLHGHLHYWYEDMILHRAEGAEEPHVTHVLGLNCDPDGADPRFYDKESSHICIDTVDLKEGRLYS